MYNFYHQLTPITTIWQYYISSILILMSLPRLMQLEGSLIAVLKSFLAHGADPNASVSFYISCGDWRVRWEVSCRAITQISKMLSTTSRTQRSFWREPVRNWLLGDSMVEQIFRRGQSMVLQLSHLNESQRSKLLELLI